MTYILERWNGALRKHQMRSALAPLLQFANPWVGAVAFLVREDAHHFHFHPFILSLSSPTVWESNTRNEQWWGVGESCIPRQGGSGSDCCESMESPREGETMYHIGSGVVLRLGHWSSCCSKEKLVWIRDANPMHLQFTLLSYILLHIHWEAVRIVVTPYRARSRDMCPYLIFVIYFTLAGFSKTKFYTHKND